MLTVACVLKTGGEYTAAHVHALQQGVAQHLSLPHQFVTLTDASGVRGETLPLLRGWPGWWSKIELYDGRLQGDVLYADLDTIVVDSLDEIALGHRFTVLENFWAHDRIGSGLLAWRADLRSIFDRFSTDPLRFMREYKNTLRWGDQGFIMHNSPVPMQRWQHLHPGKVVSFKQHCRREGRIPPAAAVVCFHGNPRPWQMTPGEWRWFSARGVQSSLRLGSAAAQGARADAV